MRTVMELVEESSAIQLEQSDIDWLHLLMSDWQVLADLAGADLVLWLPRTDGSFVALQLSRAATATTVHMDDIVGLRASQARTELLTKAMKTTKIVKGDGVNWAGSYSMSDSYVPVVHQGRPIAVLGLDANFSSPATSNGHESWTGQVADILCQMITRSEYPYDSTPNVSSRGVPRVIDGTVLIDENGIVQEITPNANSCMRRLGIRSDLVGRSLIEEITAVARSQSVIDETLAVVVMGRASWRVEVDSRSSTIALRALPLLKEGRRAGAVILTRDITEMVRREQELMTKDATIREIHHRVKNNLQTVSALLRMQSRRSDSEEVKQALREAGRRVEAIATVHEALSQNVDEIVHFDEVALSILRMTASVASTSHYVEVLIDGEFGDIPANAASALATVLTELVTNSVEHGFADRSGTIRITATRTCDSLKVIVADDGVGFAPGAQVSGLGTQIVQMMVRGELRGTIDWSDGPEGGAVVTLNLDVSV